MVRKKTVETLHEISNELAQRQKQIRTKAINLKDLEVIDHSHFKIHGLELKVQNLGGGDLDPLPLKQLCSAIGMGLGFYQDNPSLLNTKIFSERFRGLDEADGERIIRYRETEEGNRLLSILPAHHQAPNYVDIITPLAEHLPENTEMRLSNHGVVDTEHRLSMRISLLDYPLAIKSRDKDNEPCELGFFIDMSEDGRGGKMTATSMVYNQTCSNGAMITYDRHPYFSYNYRGIQGVDLGAALKSMVGRFASDIEPIHARMIESEKTLLTKNQALGFLKGLESDRSVSLGFIRKVRKEVETGALEQLSKWRVINAITFNAQTLPYDGRVQHEFVAGHLLDLNLKQAA